MGYMASLHICDVIVCQKSHNGEWKYHFLGRDYNFTHSLCAKLYSIVQKSHKENWEQINRDYCHDLRSVPKSKFISVLFQPLS